MPTRSKRRSRQRSSCCLPFVCGVGSVCVKHTGVGGIGEPTTSQQAEAARAAAGRAALLPFGGAKTNVRRHNGPNVCSSAAHFVHCAALRRGCRAASTRHRRRPLVVPTAGGAEAGHRRRLPFCGSWLSEASAKRAEPAADRVPHVTATTNRDGAVCRKQASITNTPCVKRGHG